MIDGIIQPSWSSYTSYANAIEDRLAISTPYSLNFNVHGNGTDYHAEVSVAQISANNVNKVLHLSLTESNIPESWYGGEEVNFVNRLMLPDQYGTLLLSKVTFDYDFSLQPEWVADSMELVAFVQDTITQEIFQARNFMLSDATLTYYDVALEELILPFTEFCINQIAPEIVIRNQSFENLESCLITYNINGELYDYNWMGDLEPDSSLYIVLPEVLFNLLNENNLIVNVDLPNGEEDENSENNTLEKSFSKAQIIQKQNLFLELMTDDFGSETSWILKNSLEEIVYSGNGYENSSLFVIEWDLLVDDCYNFTITDEGGNGICCENGNGYYIIKDVENELYFEGGDFGNQEIQTFQLDLSTSIVQEKETPGITVFPNPTVDWINIQSFTSIQSIQIYSSFGQLHKRIEVQSSSIKIATEDLLSGIYLLRIRLMDETIIKKIIIK